MKRVIEIEFQSNTFTGSRAMGRFLIVLCVAIGLWAALSAVTAPNSARAAADANQPAKQEVPEGFVSLFDGKTLDGWKGRSTLWKVADGLIGGETTAEKKLKHNEFLYTEKEYGDFELLIKFKLRNHNSGVQIRSRVHDANEFIVKGYQPDIAEKRYTGILYEEGGRGILVDVKPDEVAKHVNQGDWNQYRIVCKGDNIQIFVNDFQTVNYTEKKAGSPTKGVIALQLHAGPPMKVEFKDIFIKEL